MRRFVSFRRNVEGISLSLSLLFVCLFVRLIIPSSKKRGGIGDRGEFNPFPFLSLSVNLSIGRFVYFRSFFPTKFLSLFFFTSEFLKL